MSENKSQNKIWTKVEYNIPFKANSIKFHKKNVKTNQIGKEKTLEQEHNSNKIEENSPPKTLFIKKKRGRRLKQLNNVMISGTHDRFSDDNLRRKVKTHFHNYIIALLNSKFVVLSPKDKYLKFGKIKSNITQNITVEYNQTLFHTLIKDIIVEVSNKYQNKDINLQCLNYAIEHKEENDILINYLNLNYKDMYLNFYLKSTKKDFVGAEINESYEAHKENLRKFGEEYLENYIKNAENLIEFYKNCKKRKSRKKKDEESLNAPPLCFEISSPYYKEISYSNYYFYLSYLN